MHKQIAIRGRQEGSFLDARMWSKRVSKHKNEIILVQGFREQPLAYEQGAIWFVCTFSMFSQQEIALGTRTKIWEQIDA